MEDFISARSIIRKEIDVLTQHRDQAEEWAKRTIDFIKKANELPHTDIDIVNIWWEDYEYYKGKAQGLDIAIADLETIIMNINKMQDIEIQKMWEEAWEEGRNK